MRYLITLPFAAALLVPSSIMAQQNPQPQPQASQKIQAPCPPVPSKPPSELQKHVHMNPFGGKVGVLIAKETGKFSKKAGGTVTVTPPATQELEKQMQQHPCVAPVATTPPPIQPKQ